MSVIDELYEDTGIGKAESEKRMLIGKPASEWLKNEYPKWLVQYWIRKNQTFTIHGAAGSCKSFLALAMGLSVATSNRFLGKYAVRQGKVAYLYSEGKEGVRQRLEAWMLNHQIEHHDSIDNLFITSDRVGMINKGEPDVLIKSVEKWFGAYPDLILIDTLSKNFGGGDENGSDMQKFTGAIEGIRQATGAAVGIVHHTGWTNGNRERGHSSLRGDLDASFHVERNESSRIITVSNPKMKDIESGEGIYLRPRRIELATLKEPGMDDETISSLVFDLISEEEANQLDANGEKIDNCRALKALVMQPLGMVDWRKSAAMKNVRFEQTKERLIESGFVTKGIKRKDPYSITPDGESYAASNM